MKEKNLMKVIRATIKKELLIVVSEAFELNKKELFTKKETAEILSLSTRQLDRWREEGKIIAISNVEKGKVLFSKNEIIHLIKSLS